MITKVYEKIKKILKQNYIFFICLFLGIFLATYELPYYVDMPGGITNIDEKIKVENGYQSKGSFNLAYVSEMKGTIPILILSYFNKDWDILKKEEIILSNETINEASIRDHLLLEEANDNALINAFKKANKDYEIEKEDLYITYIDEQATTNLKVGDKIIAINNQKISNKKDIYNIISNSKIGEKLIFECMNEEKTFKREATIFEIEGNHKIGIMITSNKEINTTPNVTFNFKNSESGPSGGLMMSLAIYNSLIKEDITNNKKIVGTGTIDEDGIVVEIGGVIYKLKSAVKKDADIFFVPKGENYEDAIKIKKENKYDIEIVPISHFDDAISYLKTLEE